MTGDWGGRVLAVRVNDASTPWAHRDVIDVVSAAGRLDAIVLPKVTSPDHVVWLEALVFGPADFMASVDIRSLDVGGQPVGYTGGDVYHYALMRILIAARARGLQAIDGPYLKVRDVDGFRRSAASAAALGYDGKWVLHPDQIDAANEVFAPSPDDFARASRIVEAYAHATGVQARGAVMFGDEMIDEASHKMARAIVARGHASGLGHDDPGDDAGIGSGNT